MRKILFWPYQVYFWLLFLPFACLFTLLSGWVTVITAMMFGPRWASKYIASNWARVLAWLTPIKVVVEGKEKLDPKGTYVVCCNHTSQYDILTIYGFLNLDLKWVMKQELRKLPGVGIGCEKAGHIFVNRRNPEQAKKAISDALDELGDGVGILFFPEGTRSLDGKLLPFKSGAFRIASDIQHPVLPVTVLGTHEIMPAKTMRVFPGKATLVIHEPIDPQGLSTRELLDRTRESIASALPDPHVS